MFILILIESTTNSILKTFKACFMSFLKYNCLHHKFYDHYSTFFLVNFIIVIILLTTKHFIACSYKKFRLVSNPNLKQNISICIFICIFPTFSKRSLNAFQDRSITNFFRFCMNMFYPKKSILKIHPHLRRENNLQDT